MPHLTKTQIVLAIVIPCTVVIIVIAIILIQIFVTISSKPFDCVEEHNKYRNMHGSSPLLVDNHLVEVAKDWAKENARSKTMERSQNSKYGESFWMVEVAKENETVTAEMVVKAWYDEKKDYDFVESKYNPECRHFTQLVWKATKKLGCGIAQNGNFFFVVCKYEPPGNILGAFKDNVQDKTARMQRSKPTQNFI